MKKTVAILLVLVMALSLCLAGCGGSEKVTINVLNWGDYIDPDLIKQFEKETGIAVKYTTMVSNEEMLVKLAAADCIYDLCFPSDYLIEKLIGDDLLHPLDMENIPNFKNIDERFLDLEFDPDNTYSVPYMWGTLGILYNKTMVDEPVDSWRILWDEKYAGKIIMYDSIRDTLGMTLKMLGYDLNTRNEAEVAEARDALIEQKPLVRAYLTDDSKMEMINGAAAMTVIYSGDALACMEENPDLDYAVPMEGSNYWFDNMIIPKTSQHTAEAEAFINFLIGAEVCKQNTEYIYYCCPNAAAMELFDDELREDPVFNPSQELLDRCTLYHDLGDFISVYTDAWTKVKAA